MLIINRRRLITGASALAAFSTIKLKGAKAATGHRYWRINVQSNVAGSFLQIQEATMALSISGSNVFGSGTATADSSFDGTVLPPNVVDGNPSTVWATASAGNGWWQYDFGSGNNFDIVETIITPPTTLLTRSPSQWTLIGSDDGTTFFGKQAFVAGSWVLSTPQTFDATYRAQSWDPLIVAPGTTLSGSNLIATFTTGSFNTQTGTAFFSSGKWYFEVSVTAVGNACFIGVSQGNPPGNTWVANNSNGTGWENTGDTWNNSGLNHGGGGGLTYTTGDVIGIAGNGTNVFARKNGGGWNGLSGPADPVANTGGFDMSSYFAASGGVLPAISGNGATKLTANFTGPFVNPSPFAIAAGPRSLIMQ